MNAIQCKHCGDILVPVVQAGIRTCVCGMVQMRAVPKEENQQHLVEVKLLDTEVDGVTCAPNGARVIKLSNPFLCEMLQLHEFTDVQRDTNDLFYQNQSQIVITPLDTPGVKLVDEWSNKSLPSTKEYELPDTFTPTQINIITRQFDSTKKIWVTLAGVHFTRMYCFYSSYHPSEMVHVLCAGSKVSLSQDNTQWNILNIFKSISSEKAEEWLAKTKYLS